jgi:murein DD-endopeptidase MepM/ murein hydrolase activator NlpD
MNSSSGQQPNAFLHPLKWLGHLVATPDQHRQYRPKGNWESDNAIDIGVSKGTPVHAVADGVIGSKIGALNSKRPDLLGKRLHLKTADNEFYYAHLSEIAPGIAAGTAVKQGQLLGYTGVANNVPHLHFGMKNGNPLDMQLGSDRHQLVPPQLHISRMNNIPGSVPGLAGSFGARRNDFGDFAHQLALHPHHMHDAIPIGIQNLGTEGQFKLSDPNLHIGDINRSAEINRHINDTFDARRFNLGNFAHQFKPIYTSYNEPFKPQSLKLTGPLFTPQPPTPFNINLGGFQLKPPTL